MRRRARLRIPVIPIWAQATPAAIIRSLVAKGALTIEVRLTPRASRNEISGFRDGVLICRVTAPPVDDRANVALCKLVAKRLGVAPSRVRIARGARGRNKLLSVEGAPSDARSRLGG